MNKYTHINGILERVSRKLPPSLEVNKSEVVELTWEAMRKMGALSRAMLNTYSFTPIVNYKAIIPSFLEGITTVNLLVKSCGSRLASEDIMNEDELSAASRYQMAVNYSNGRGIYSGYRKPHSQLNEQVQNEGYRYIEQDGHLLTTVEDGIVEICGVAFPLDEQGMPRVPTEPYYLDAVTWYIVYHLLWRATTVNRTYEWAYREAERKKDFYIAAARNKMIIPNKDGMKAMAERFLRIVPLNMYRQPGAYNRYGTPTLNAANAGDIVIYPYGSNNTE